MSLSKKRLSLISPIFIFLAGSLWGSMGLFVRRFSSQGLSSMDMITIGISDNDKLAGIVENNKDEILKATMATEVTTDTNDGYVKEWKINGESVKMSVKKN